MTKTVKFKMYYLILFMCKDAHSAGSNICKIDSQKFIHMVCHLTG